MGALPEHYRRTAVEAREDDRLYRRVVSPQIMGRCPDSGVTSCPAGTCGQEAPARAGAGSLERGQNKLFPQVGGAQPRAGPLHSFPEGGVKAGLGSGRVF